MTDWPFDTLTPFRYGAILADPPWAYAMRSKKGHAKSPEAHYETMDLDEIKALPVAQLAGPDCYLFLWSTWPHVKQALEVLEAWSFTYVTGGAWLKRSTTGKVAMGTGYVLRSASEPYLVGKIGRPQVGSRSERNVILAPEAIPDQIDSLRREHSRKPPEMRQMIERLRPRSYYAELFGREAWDGHDVWGNQADRFDTEVRANV
ncbi:MT-A70 family methyltransferase [Puniceibacterium sp. IMCC21224]|uniref:MT-A70 family methyltransferase n=1 Tax=Puniceibacterium sp. IMCC21224 TaxID=1618204 RepID=UPI00064E08EF|nr:MT-A70 family methyltransferase [Puniceibacterium sp. IMCC21224]KMK68565.1 transcriptional activator, adenine-specific DNA methyltransferase [Puniceibacterium sp. IMCC21224]